MINWNTDEKTFKKKYPKEYKLWRLTQLINYGLDGEKLSIIEVKKAWPKIKNRIEPQKARIIEFLLWNKLNPLPEHWTTFKDWYTSNPIKDPADQTYSIKRKSCSYEVVSEYGKCIGSYVNLKSAREKLYQINNLKYLALRRD